MKRKKENSIGAELGSSIKDTCNFLTILFCALRACGIIHWSWFWIMSPIFFSWVLTVILIIIAGLLSLALLDENGGK